MPFPPGHHYTEDQLIDDHTLLPFYSPFCPPERIGLVRADMKGSNGSLVHGRLGIFLSRIPQWLQFCPLCVQSDVEQFGEPYWHRLHQVPGIEVCPIHAVFLEQSHAAVRHQRQPWEFVSANRVIRATNPRPLTLTEPPHQVLLKIACDAAWLLGQRQLTPGLDSLRRRYLKLLAQQGLATYRGNIYAVSLVEAFKNFYPTEFLEHLKCSFDSKSQNHWLFRLIRFSLNKAQYPLHHLLLIHFLGYTAAEFFQLPSEFHPFGEGPWPCLNRASDHFEQLQIKECRITYHHQRSGSRPVGTFACTCGFVYSRTGPDESVQDKYRIGLLKSYGPVWEALLKELWLDSTVSIPEIARQLGVSFGTVTRHATALSLPFPRPGSWATQVLAVQQLCAENTRLISPQTVETYRQKWLEARLLVTEATRKLLRKRFNSLYVWLSEHDSEWFEAHLPEPVRSHVKSQQPPRVDWHSRDVQLATLVRESAQRLRTASGRPIWLTKTAIAKDIGHKTLISKEINMLPYTAQALADVVETRQEYAIRRLWWATECFQQENVCPPRWLLLQRACLKPPIVAKPAVREAIEAALSSLQPLRTE